MDLQIHNSGSHQQKLWKTNLKTFGYNRGYVSGLRSEVVFRKCLFAEVDVPSTFFCKAEVKSLSQSVAPNDFRCLNVFDCLATALVRGEGDAGNGGRSIFDGSRIRIGRGMVTGMIAGATGIVDRGRLCVVIEELNKFSEKEVGFSLLVDVCAVDPLSIYLEFISETDGAEGKWYFFQLNLEMNPGFHQYIGRNC